METVPGKLSLIILNCARRSNLAATLRRSCGLSAEAIRSWWKTLLDIAAASLTDPRSSFINHKCGFVAVEAAAAASHLPGFRRSQVTLDF